MKTKALYILLFCLQLSAFSQLNFSSVDSLFAYAERNSSVSKINDQQALLSKWTKIAAIGNTVNFRSPVSFTATDNLLLPVSFIPAAAFGGPAGTFKQITLGQQYVSNFNFNPQIDIISPYNWAKVKSASISNELTEINNKIARKNLFESIAAAYCNIISLQEQITIVKQNVAAADTLELIAKNKLNQGLIRVQDYNNTSVNRLLISDKLNQLNVSLQQQLNALKILCDIPAGKSLILLAPAGYYTSTYNAQLKASSSLLLKNSILQASLAKSELRANRFSMLPVISAVYYQGWQHNSNDAFFDSKQAWIQSQYIGLRITMPFPPEVMKLSQSYNAKINYRIASLNAEHAKLQNEINNKNLELDYEKAFISYTSAKEIYSLKNDNYLKYHEQYREGIISTDIMLSSFTDMLNAKINFVSSQALLEFNKIKITINNL